MELQSIIKALINKGSEGGYWDFKQCWHSNNADLLKDIICMANNTTTDMQDGYIIFGVEDCTHKIIGVAGDSNRKNQENIIGFLHSKSWTGEEVPCVDVHTIEIDGLEVDVLSVRNSDVTPFYLLKDYSKSTNPGAEKTILRAGVIYSRVGDRNTSSMECATKQSVEFLWKKRFGLAGTDEYKVIKRLQNIDNWYSNDENFTLDNREYGDIKLVRDPNYELTVDIDDGRPETATWVMDFPYLFTYMLNWNIGKNETGRRAKWDVFLNGRQLEISLYGVQGTRQSYYHIEPNKYDVSELGVQLHKTYDSIIYYAYTLNSIRFLAYKLFFKECYDDSQIAFNKAFTVIPVFEDKQEHIEFIDYVKGNKGCFASDVEAQGIGEMFPTYAQAANTVIVYKVGKTLVQWLDRWRQQR